MFLRQPPKALLVRVGLSLYDHELLLSMLEVLLDAREFVVSFSYPIMIDLIDHNAPEIELSPSMHY